MLQTRSQKFAASAYQNVNSIIASADRDKYKAITRNLPVLIQTAGLAQALAFIPSGEAQKKMHETLIKHLSATIEKEDLARACREASLHEYMRLTRDTLDALVWYKRFAESLIDVK
ncbi:MAG: CRISPR-associated protein Cmr5 [Blastocatellia bacterium]